METKRLIIGPIPPDFRLGMDLVLSPYCFIGQERYYPHWYTLDYAFPSVDSATFCRESESLLNNVVLPKIADELNHRHNVKYDILFWRTLIMPFIFEYWGVAAQLFFICEEAKRQFADTALLIQRAEVVHGWGFADMVDFSHRGLHNPNFLYAVASHWIFQDAPAAWKFSTQPLDIPGILSRPPKGDDRFRRVNNLGFTGVQGLILSLVLAVKAIVKPIQTLPYAPPLIPQPLPTGSTPFYTHFVPQVLEMIYRDLPESVTTHFAYFQKKSQNRSYKKGGLRLIQTAFYHHEYVKYYIAHAEAAGEVIMGSQHGGGYGLLETHFSSQELEIKGRYFASWGWKGGERYTANILPLPSPVCTRGRFHLNPKRPIIVWVSTHLWIAGLNLYYSESIGVDWIVYLQNKLDFLAELSPHRFNQLRYRTHPDKRASLNEVPTLQHHYPELKCCEGDLHHHLKTASLVILDNFSTTLNFVLAAEIPFIIIEPPGIRYSAEAQSLIALWKSAGVLFSTPQKAANWLNNVSDISTWWSSHQVRAAQKEGKDKYAKTSPTLLRDWINALWAL